MASVKLTNALRRSSAMGPSVKNLLAQYKIDPNGIKSTGPHQILIKSDVLNYIDQMNLKPMSQVDHNPSNTRLVQPTSQASSSGSSKVTLLRTSDMIAIKSRYRRNYPSQLEIDVINNGGRLD